MIIDYKNDGKIASRYSIFDVETGECLDRECIFFADDEAGYYLHHLGGPTGKHFRDAYTETGRYTREIAWERVDRRIAIRPKVINA